MLKAQLRQTEDSRLQVRRHGLVDAHNVIEVFHKGEFIAAIYGADGPGIRIISKHNPASVKTEHDGALIVGVIPLNVTTILYETEISDQDQAKRNA